MSETVYKPLPVFPVDEDTYGWKFVTSGTGKLPDDNELTVSVAQLSAHAIDLLIEDNPKDPPYIETARDCEGDWLVFYTVMQSLASRKLPLKPDFYDAIMEFRDALSPEERIFYFALPGDTKDAWWVEALVRAEE